MGRVNIVKQVKVDGKWILRSIPKKKSGHYDMIGQRCQTETTSWSGGPTDGVGVSQQATPPRKQWKSSGESATNSKPMR